MHVPTSRPSFRNARPLTLLNVCPAAVLIWPTSVNSPVSGSTVYRLLGKKPALATPLAVA